MQSKKLSESQIKDFHRDGFLVIKEFCNKQEIDKLYTTADFLKKENDPALKDTGWEKSVNAS